MKLTCIKCGQIWNVSDKHSKIGPYVCPRCAKRGDGNGAKSRAAGEKGQAVRRALSEVYHDGVSAGEAVLLRYSKFQ